MSGTQGVLIQFSYSIAVVESLSILVRRSPVLRFLCTSAKDDARPPFYARDGGRSTQRRDEPRVQPELTLRASRGSVIRRKLLALKCAERNVNSMEMD